MEKKDIIFVGAATLIAVNTIKAIRFKEDKNEKKDYPYEYVNTERYLKTLSEAITCKTVSAYDEKDVDWNEFKKFHKLLSKSYPLMHEKLELKEFGNASLMFKWEGSNPNLNPIALLGHQDVVPISEGTEKDWKHDPYSGFNDGEFIWGRGSLDMKNHLLAVMEGVETLLEEGYKPERTVYICLGHNEEVAAVPDNGAKEMAEYFQNNGIRLEAVLDEGGAVIPLTVPGIIDRNLAAVGLAEKGNMNMRISVKGKGGHSSQPPKHTALGKIANVITDIENHPFKPDMPDYLFQSFITIGKNCSFPARMITCHLPAMKPLLTFAMSKIPAGSALIRNCQAVTMAKGSPQFNILPEEASITVNFRTMPGVTVKDIENHIRKHVREKDLDIEFFAGQEASKESTMNSLAFKTIKSICENTGDKTVLVPFLVIGGTDSHNYEIVCDNIYRFMPFLVEPDILTTTHGTNERFPIKSAEKAVAFFKRYIKEMTSSDAY